MSSQVEIHLTAYDEASSVIESVGANLADTNQEIEESSQELAGATDDVTNEIANDYETAADQVSSSAEEMSDANDEANASLLDSVSQMNSAAIGAGSLVMAWNNMQNAQVSLDRANLQVQKSTIAVQEAQNAYNAAVEKYGADSPQAQLALEKLQEAQDALTVAHERANEAARNYDVTLMMSALTVIPSLVSIINVASNAEEIWEGVQWALNAAMDANPIGIVIVAIAALVAAFVLAYTHCKSFRDAINDLGTVLGGFFKEAVEVVAKALETEWTAAVTVVEAVLNGLKAAFNGLVAVWNTIHNAWDVFCSAISSIWNSTVGLVVKAVEDFANTIHTIFETLFGWIVGGSIWKDLCSGIETIWNDTAGALLKDVQAFANNVASIFKDMGKGIGGAFKDISSDVTSAISDIGSSVYKGFTDAEKSVSNAMQSVAKDVSGGLKDAGSAITNFINSICFAHALKSASDDSSNTMSSWTSMMEGSMTKGVGHVQAFVAAMPGQFDTVKTVLNGGIASFNNLANGIGGAVSSSEASMNAWLSNLQSNLAAGISAIQAFNASICFAHGLQGAVAQSRETMDSWNTMLSASMQRGLDSIRGFNNEVGLSGLGAGIASVGSYGGVPTGGGAKPVNVTVNAPLVNIEGSADKQTVQLASQQVLQQMKSVIVEPTSSSAPANQKRIRIGGRFS